MYLEHHGIQGQRWGVRNGPPYPLKPIHFVSKDYKAVNDIFATLPLKDRRKLFDGVSDKELMSRTYTDKKEYDEELINSFILKVNNVPVSALDIWYDGGTKGSSLTLMTRKGEEGKGYAKQVIEKGMEFIEANKDIEYTTWSALNTNKASLHLAKKYGFIDMYKDKTWSTLIKEKWEDE